MEGGRSYTRSDPTAAGAAHRIKTPEALCGSGVLLYEERESVIF